VAVIASLRISIYEAALLLVLFLAQFVVVDEQARIWFSGLYIVLLFLVVLRNRKHIVATGRFIPGFLRSNR
jgi:hypothetical protein